MAGETHCARVSKGFWNGTCILSAIAMLLSGCSSASIRGATSKNFEATVTTPVAIERKDERDVLVVIRYPAIVEPGEAETLYRNLYENRGFTNIFFQAPADTVKVPWVGQDLKGYPTKDMEGAHLEALTKTVYVAIDFYRYLEKLLPANSVRLQPVRIVHKAAEKTGAGVIASQETAPVMLVEEAAQWFPPVVLYVDIFAHVHPYWRVEEGTTFGKTVVPLITIRTAPRAAPKTHGGIATVDAFLPYTRMARGIDAAADALGVTFINYLNATAGVPPAHVKFAEENLSHSPSSSLDQYVILPLETVTLDETVMRQQAGQEKVDGTPATPIYAKYYQIIRQALGLISYDVATRNARIDYVSWFDPVLGSLLESGASLSAHDEAKLATLRKFESAEWTFLGKKDNELIENSFLGPWGAFMRDHRMAEEGFRERYEKAKAEAQASLHAQAWASGLSAMAANPSGGLGLAMGAIQLVHESAREQAKINKQLAGLSRTFRQHLENTMDKESSFLFDIAGETVEVRARSLEELRFKMKRLYGKSLAVKAVER